MFQNENAAGMPPGEDEEYQHGEPGNNLRRRNVESSEEKGGDQKQCTDDEILAIICHELGHWKMWHVAKRFVISMFPLLLSTISVLFAYLSVFSSCQKKMLISVSELSAETK